MKDDSVKEALELLSGIRKIKIFHCAKYFTLDFDFSYEIDRNVSSVAEELIEVIKHELEYVGNVSYGHKIVIQTPMLINRTLQYTLYDQASGVCSSIKVEL